MAGGEEDVKVRDQCVHIVIARGHQFEGRLHMQHWFMLLCLARNASAQQPGNVTCPDHVSTA